MQFTTMTLAALTAATAMAAPFSEPQASTVLKRSSLMKRVDPGAQSCTCTDSINDGQWYVTVGLPYNDAAAQQVCDGINQQRQVAQCIYRADEDGNYLFSIQDKIGNGIDSILNTAFSAVFPPTGGSYGNINGFNCPAY